MSTIHLHQTTTLTPAQYTSGLTDFGPSHSKLFGNSSMAILWYRSWGAAGSRPFVAGWQLSVSRSV